MCYYRKHSSCWGAQNYFCPGNQIRILQEGVYTRCSKILQRLIANIFLLFRLSWLLINSKWHFADCCCQLICLTVFTLRIFKKDLMGIITFPHRGRISSCLPYILLLPVQAFNFLKDPCHFLDLTLPILKHCHRPITQRMYKGCHSDL